MPRLTIAERNKIKERVLNGATTDEVMKEFILSRKQAKRYIDDYSVELTEVKEGEIEQDETVDEEECEELSLDEILPKPKETVAPQLDPNKDYCGNCYEQNKITEISNDMAQCPICGEYLEWQQS